MYKIKEITHHGNLVGKLILRTNLDGTVTSFGEYPDNTDYQAYLKYIAEGGVVLPADQEGVAP